MPYYRTFGKIQQPLTDQDFVDGMTNGTFIQERHKGYCVLLYYSAVRKAEALRATKEQFDIRSETTYFSVGKRLKHGIETPSLPLPHSAAYMNDLETAIEDTEPRSQVFPYSLKTGYNIVRRAFKYPHLFRLSRITNFFLEGWTIAQVHSWTGLTLKALDYYIGLVDVAKMGESLAGKKA
jgi:integrase